MEGAGEVMTTKNDPTTMLYSVKQAATRLDRSERTVRKYMKELSIRTPLDDQDINRLGSYIFGPNGHAR